MDRHEYRDDEEDDDVVATPDTYWRRRAITLALGLGLLGMLAWGFSGGGAKNQVTPLPATALGTAVPGAPAASPGATGPGSSGSGTAGPGAGASSKAEPAPSASEPAGAPRPTASGASPDATPTPSGPDRLHQPSPSPAPGSGGCAPGSVVLSLFTDRASYSAQQDPRFSVYAVSTTSAGCTFSPAQLQVVVMSSDRIIWNSSDCGRGSSHDARAATLARGVPVRDDVDWNRDITLPGCQVLAIAAHPGSYEVQARTATVQSPVRNFKLTG